MSSIVVTVYVPQTIFTICTLTLPIQYLHDDLSNFKSEKEIKLRDQRQQQQQQHIEALERQIEEQHIVLDSIQRSLISVCQHLGVVS